MPHTLYLAPCSTGAGITSIALGLVSALDKRGIRVAFCKPIGQPTKEDEGPERSTHFIRERTNLNPVEPIALEDAERLISADRMDELMEKVVGNFHRSAGDADVVVVEGLVYTPDLPGGAELNRLLVRTLSADVILVGSLAGLTMEEFEDRLEFTARQYGGVESGPVIGCILNRVPDAKAKTFQDAASYVASRSRRLGHSEFPLIGAIPDNPTLTHPRAIDIARHLNAEVLYAGEIESRRVKNMTVLARTVPNLIHTFQAGAMLITPSDRYDVITAIALAALKAPIGGLILTGDLDLDDDMMKFCEPGWETGLPVLHVRSNSYNTATALGQMSSEVPADDLERVQLVMDHVSHFVDADWLAAHAALPVESRMSPAAFCYRITERAREFEKRIVLPEGTEPRTILAASLCAQRGIAKCVLLGPPDEIRRIADAQEIQLPSSLELVDPAAIRGNYVAPLVEMRKHKGLTPKDAAELLEDTVWLGTVMLALGEVDGLVSGAVHSSANTIRPALQIIKTKPEAKAVSSIFFMCLPEQVLVYGDCAVNPDPDAETLADIALQSAESAERFGIPARVAMISYSTGHSGSGVDVDKVREATRIAKEKRPDLLLDGPLQYDAAAIADVAATKAPNSPVAGKATVYVFPDLNTGNTTYKAVQRSANVISIGPMLQGLKRPVNDLSRGALVEDIVYTIAITAIQAGQN
ncbi:phosphate acetyltransferase [Spartobacteria bacterium LR76]|nr:phosphate acetyltransferase [Spartobacteria bacterium LR76]